LYTLVLGVHVLLQPLSESNQLIEYGVSMATVAVIVAKGWKSERERQCVCECVCIYIYIYIYIYIWAEFNESGFKHLEIISDPPPISYAGLAAAVLVALLKYSRVDVNVTVIRT